MSSRKYRVVIKQLKFANSAAVEFHIEFVVLMFDYRVLYWGFRLYLRYTQLTTVWKSFHTS